MRRECYLKGGGLMVCVRISSQCERGKHRDCKGKNVPPAPKGEMVFGGWICSCGCHNDPERFFAMEKILHRKVKTKKIKGNGLVILKMLVKKIARKKK